ncbi:Dynein_heavy chain [Hexamita inflata]|uniref:Dynein heavy chain n=1 Tax=Hexamita inflata TaxID=28002 RepID=A0AA86UGF9_9EUKA|nr:Dynein heavy chain [Hexamita inflata]
MSGNSNTTQKPKAHSVLGSTGSLKHIVVPAGLQQIANKTTQPIVEHKLLPNELKTTRLKPTEKLPEEYRTGAVEGVESKWREASLRGIQPGPINRLNKNFIDKTQKTEVRPLSSKLQKLSDKIGGLMRSNNYFIKNQDVKMFADVVNQMFERETVNNNQTLDQLTNLIFDRQQFFYNSESEGDFIQQIDAVHLINQDKNKSQEDMNASRTFSQLTAAAYPHDADIIILREKMLQDNNESKLPLEYFDSGFYETHTPEEWLQKHSRQFIYPNGEQVTGAFAYSRYLNNKKLSLEPCIVLSYDEKSNTYLIRWLTEGSEVFSLNNTCTASCQKQMELNQVKKYEKVNSTVPNAQTKYVKRLNLLFRDEQETQWWRRREDARLTRRIFDKEMNLKRFLDENIRKTVELKQFQANPDYKLDFTPSQLVEFLADVSGVTSEIIDNIFHDRVLYDWPFKRFFLDKLDQQSYKSIVVKSGQLVVTVAKNFTYANMVATLDYLRRSADFEQNLTQHNLSMPMFSKQYEKQLMVVKRRVATLSCYQDPLESLASYAARQARIKTLLFSGKTQYFQAFMEINQVFQIVATLEGLYFFNFAGIIPFIATDQVKLLRNGFAGGAANDKESFQVYIGEKKDSKSMLECIPFYAHPGNKNVTDLGFVSPALPLPIKQFQQIGQEHRVRMISHLNDMIFENMGDNVLDKLKTSNIDVSQDKRIFDERIMQLQEMDDFYSLPHEGSVQLTNSLVLHDTGNCVERPRPRNLYDLMNFFKMVNLRLYDIIMHSVKLTAQKYVEMLREFQVQNVMSYDKACKQVNSIIKESKNKKLSDDQVKELIYSTKQQIFATCTTTYTKQSLIQLYLSLEPFMRDVRQVQNGQELFYFAQYVDKNVDLELVENKQRLTYQGHWSIRNTKEIVIQKMQMLAQAEETPEKVVKEEQKSVHFTNDEYLQVLSQQQKLCPSPTVLEVCPEYLPNLKDCRKVFEQLYDDILNVPKDVLIIDQKAICLQDEEKPHSLRGPDPVHDQWIPLRQREFQILLDNAQQGPECFIQVIEFIVRQLYYINVYDHVDEYNQVKVLPYLDDHINNEKLQNEINNAEDQNLITCDNWDYLWEVKTEVKKEVKIVEAEQDSDNGEENQEDDENKEEVHKEEKKEVEENPIKIINDSMSLRDLRNYVLRIQVIQNMLRNIPAQLNIGLYTINSQTAIDILLKKIMLIKSQLTRIIQIRIIKLSQQIINDWKHINERMHAKAETAQQYHDSKLYIKNIHQTIKEMRGKETILIRYQKVIEEFSLSYNDCQKTIFAADEHFVFASNLDLTQENRTNQYQQLYNIHLESMRTKEKFADNERAIAFWTARAQPKLIVQDCDYCERQLSKYFQDITKKTDNDRSGRIEDIRKFQLLTESFMQTAKLSNDAEINNNLKAVETIKENKKLLKDKINTLMQDEKFLGFPPTDFSEFTMYCDQFQIFEDLWAIVGQTQSKFASWREGFFNQIDPKEVQNLIADWGSNLSKLAKNFQKLSKGTMQLEGNGKKDYAMCCLDAQNQAQDLMEKVDEFGHIVPLINALRNPGLNPKTHWKEISTYTNSYKEKGEELQLEGMTLTQLISEGLLQQEMLEQIIRISNDATREATIQKQLDKMVWELNKLQLEFKLFATDQIQLNSANEVEKRIKEQPYYIVRSFDEASQLIDEQFSALQGIRASSYGAKFELKFVGPLERKLDTIQQIIDNWLVFQRLWLYLHPIFSSDDIKKQLPSESNMFQDVCSYWSNITQDMFKTKDKILDKMAQTEKLAVNLETRFQTLEEVNKKLSSYLHSKRMSFSRFFFLADEELLQILAQTRNVEAVQAHIQKCFEGIKKLTFETQNGQKIITQIISPEGEIVPLEKSVQTNGDVDLWLNDIELQMKLTVKGFLGRCWADYVQTVQKGQALEETQDAYQTLMGPRELWLAKGPAQIVNALSQVVWTYETQNAIEKDTLTYHFNEQNNRIDRLVLWIGCTPDIIKKYPTIQYNKNIRKMLTTILTLWVHNRDIISKLIKKEGDPDFLFASQLKYYFEETNKRMYIKQVDAQLDYQYEYLGNHDRLVITPLTDKCFLTLTSALAKTFGGNPLGPAGTGKSESVKDLSKSLAIGCYIFNCSEGLNEQSLSRFFAGLCICGMYSCLDEFNRCRLDVLSVVAQQILSIQRAIRANKKQFEFEGTTIRLQSCCGIFITMNPGYAGRAELPTNLKNLFRPIAMTVPDYTMISEISLFACGYRQATALAVKIVMTLRLSSEQLSKASHYDFGMRALKSILNAASRLKRLYWAEKEDILCLRAICDVNVPKFLAADLPLFQNIISDLFIECYQIYQKQINSCPDEIYTMPLADITVDMDADHLVKRFIYEQAKILKLSPTTIFIDKTMQLYATLTVRHGLMNVGLTMTGKSAVLSTLQGALGLIRNFLNERPDLTTTKYTYEAYPLFYPAQIFKINAKSITADELYGNFSADSNEWSDGILCTAMRECVRDSEEKKLKWIVMDSPVDALWIENLNTILDDSKRLCLTSGEVIAMTDQTAYMFEVRDLEVASPATVSRCGMIYFDATVVNNSDMFKSLCQTMLPQWFQDLDTNQQSCWPIFQFQSEEQNIKSFEELVVEGKNQQTGVLHVQIVEKEQFKAIDRLCCLFDWLFESIFKYIFGQYKPVILQKDTTVIYNLAKLIASFINQFKEPDAESTITEGQGEELKASMPPLSDKGGFVDSVFTFALTWSLGAVGDQNIRNLFTQAFRHFAYDLPAVLVNQSALAGVDLNGKVYKFSNSSNKVNQQLLDAIKARSQQFQSLYRKSLPFNKPIWRLEKQLAFADKKQMCLHDFCLGQIDVKTEKRSIYTAMVVAEQKDIEWQLWASSCYAIHQEEFLRLDKFNETIVPTPDVISLTHIISLLAQQNYPVLLAGPSGSGKTSLAKKLVESRPWTSVKCVLTAQTTSTQLRAVVDTKIERKRKGIYGFPKGKKALFYVDDVHMPAKEQYGAQPPLEVLRQLFEDQGWYDIQQGIFKKIINMATIIGCTTNGAQGILPERLMHHLTLVSIPENTDDAFKQIFTVLLNPLSRIAGTQLLDNVVLATIQLYRSVCNEFKPTPAHTHYVFGPRDLSKIFQGLLLPLKGAAIQDAGFRQHISKPATISGLWANECQRVFGDRLINIEDLQEFNKILSNCWSNTEVSVAPLERLVPDGSFNSLQKVFDINFGPSGSEFYTYLNLNDQTSSDATAEYYRQVLEKYNKTPMNTPMNLILFRYALNHLIRITRILQTDRGHGLLIGMPSSGKRSLTRLAFMSLESFYQGLDAVVSDKGYVLTDSKRIEIFEPNSRSDFLDVVRKAVIHCGQKSCSGVLILQEALTDNFCLECVNFLISLGEIPNLFPAEDLKLLLKAMEDQLKDVNDTKPEGEKLDTGKQAIMEIISERVLRNLHIIVAVTPQSAALDRIVTSFPSLLGSLTVNWFTPWEIDTLRSIAKYYLKNEDSYDKIVEVLVMMHQDSEKKIIQKYPNLCTSPATFLALIQSFKDLKKSQLKVLDEKLQQYITGVQKMEETDQQVKEIQIQQQKLQPVLLQKQAQVRKLQNEIEDKKKQMMVTSEELAVEEQKAAKAKAEADELASICEEEVKKAMPIKLRAERALGALKNEDVMIMKKMGSPPETVKMVMEATCIILRAKMTPGADNWSAIKTQFSNPKIIYNLKEIKTLTADLADIMAKHYVNNEIFQAKVVEKSSVPAAGLCEWIHALYDYYVVMLDIQPKLDREAIAKQKSRELAEQLAKQQAELKKAQDIVTQLEQDGQQKQEELKKLNDMYTKCCDDLTRAEQLISGLAGEQKRWKESVQIIQKQVKKVIPTSLLATAYCAQLGGMEFLDREFLSQKWCNFIIEQYATEEEPLQELTKFSLDTFLYDIPTISHWLSKGLGKDTFSLSSASIAMNANKVPLLLDPQGQGRIWASNCLATKQLNKSEKGNKIVTVRYSDQNLQKYIKDALTSGYSLVIEQISSDEFIKNDPRIKAAIIAHNKIQASWTPTNLQFTVPVTYADGKDVEVPESFRLILITTFDVVIPPDLFNDFRVVTFKVTREALQDLLINQAVERDDKKSEELRVQLTNSIAQMQAELQKNEKVLLDNLVNSQGSPIENLQLIELVKKLSAQSVDVKRKMEKAVISQKENEEKRSKYKELASICASLFFVLLRLVKLDQMYENSLQNFVKIYIQTFVKFRVDEVEQATKPERLQLIQQTFAEKLYQTVSRGLFVNHKLSFSLDIALTLDQARGKLSRKQFELVIASCSRNLNVFKKANVGENKFAKYKITDDQWANFDILCQQAEFRGMNTESWQLYEKFFNEEFTSTAPLSELEYFLFCVLLKDAEITKATQVYINAAIGQAFTNTESPQLIDICQESSNTIPTLILLSSDSDPSNQLVQLADTSGIIPASIATKIRFISLGRGQGGNAEKAINEAVKDGGWVILGNTHLAGSWLMKLESLIEAINMETYDPNNTGKFIPINDHFRLFLTTMPFGGFPASIIRQATKVSAEAPMGVKNNFIRLVKQLEPEDTDLISVVNYAKLSQEKQQTTDLIQQTYRKYLWNLSVYFSTVLERRRFGPIGFSTGYDWSDPDYIISKMQLNTMFKDLLQFDLSVVQEKIQNCVSALRFLISEINVGGRVSDHKDQLIVNSLMEAYYQEDLNKLGGIVEQSYAMPYKLMQQGSYMDYVQHAKDNWNENDIPELFGLDQISIIISKSQKGRDMLSTVLLINSSSDAQVESGSTDLEYQQLQKILDEMPQKFALNDILEKYPTNYSECMNTVITQECTRFNNLHQTMSTSLKQTQSALKGLVLKTAQTEDVRSCVRLNAVPAFWAAAAWPSLMPLASWLKDFSARYQFLKDWTETGQIKIVWFSGFFYPQAFITGTLQNFARKNQIAIDKLALDFAISAEVPVKADNEQILTGLFLQGAALNKEMHLTDAFQQFEEVKYLKLTPMLSEQLQKMEKTRVRYKCPVYRTTLRKGVLTTTGHSSNYIFDVLVDCEGADGKRPAEKKEIAEKWVRRGTAMFQQKE